MTHRPRTSTVPVARFLRGLGDDFLVGFAEHAVETADAKEISPERMTYVVRAVRDARAGGGQHPRPEDRRRRPFRLPPATEAPRQVNGMGTGVVIDERGYILTNYHVVADVRRIQVTLVRPPRVHRRDGGPRPRHRPGRDQDSGHGAAARDHDRHVVGPDGRRAGDRPGQRLRLRAHRDPRHHQRAGPRRAGQRNANLRRLDPDRRQHQPRQLRRAADERRRRDDRRERGRASRGPGDRLCHSGRPGDARRGRS